MRPFWSHTEAPVQINLFLMVRITRSPATLSPATAVVIVTGKRSVSDGGEIRWFAYRVFVCGGELWMIATASQLQPYSTKHTAFVGPTHHVSSPTTQQFPRMSASIHVSTHPCVRAKLSQLRSGSTSARDTKTLVHDIATIVGVEALAKGLEVESTGTVSPSPSSQPT